MAVAITGGFRRQVFQDSSFNQRSCFDRNVSTNHFGSQLDPGCVENARSFQPLIQALIGR
jgi:hypothetical protein